MKMPELLLSENSKRTIVVLVIVALGIFMAARKQFIVNYTEVVHPYDYSVIEGNEKNLSHIHPMFHKDGWSVPVWSIIPYSLHFSKSFYIISSVIQWILIIALVALIFRRAGFNYYCSIVLTMFVLFVGNLVVREVFDIPLLPPAPYSGYQNFDFRIFGSLSALASILFAAQGRLILSGALVGLTAVLHLKYGLRMFCLLLGCMILWNLWGYRLVKAPNLKISWRSFAGFCCCWIVPFVATYLYVLGSVRLFAELMVPRATTSFLPQLGWLFKSEPDDWLISLNFHSNVQFFGFLFLAIVSIFLCELIRRRTLDIKQKIMTVILILSIFVALLFFGYGFLFETFLIDLLPLSWSATLMQARIWDLVWVVVVAFTIAVFLSTMLWIENLGQKFQKPTFVMQKLFLHIASAVFVLFNIYIFVDKKGGSVIREFNPVNLASLHLSYTQICTEDTPLYKKTLSGLWTLAEKQSEAKFYKQLQLLEDIFDRTLKPVSIEQTNNPDVKNMQTLYNIKSQHYRLALQELVASDHELLESGHIGRDSPYFWGCDKKGPGLHRELVKIPFRDFNDVSQWIKQNTQVDRGVIFPPYFSRFGLYSRRVSFWEGNRDGDLMTVRKEYFPIGLHRLRSLAGPYALLQAPGIRYGRIGLKGRAYFLSLRQEDLREIRINYPHYDYLVTENQVLSGFPKLYANDSFAVYDISENKF
jgi:hypothetical protein